MENYDANYLRETIDVIKQIETRFMELAARLHTISTRQLWKGGYTSFSEFLEAAQMSKGNASILIKVYETYVLNGGVPAEKLKEVAYSNLYQAIPLIERDGVEKTIETARTLTRAEIKEEVREDKHGDCQHAESILICTTCHKRIS